jgi:glycosyltransferase involved in cell wall biosynthesis
MPEDRNSPSLKILLLGPSMATGGAQRVLLEQADWFEQSNHTIIAAFLYDREGLNGRYVEECAFPMINLEAWRPGSGLANIFHLIGGLVRLYRLMRKERFHVIESFTHHANLLGLPVAWAAGVPVRVAGHHGRVERLPTWLGRIHTLVVNSKITSSMVAVSRGVQTYAIEDEGIAPEKIVVIPNGHALPSQAQINSAVHSRLCDELGLRPEGLLVLSVGRLTEQKGHVYLLEAIPAILEQFPDTIFAVAGDGPLRADLEARAKRLGIAKSVRLLGTRFDVPELLQMAHIFVLPSLWEGLPIALLEAMGAGLPVVATRVEGVEEVIVDGENGLLLPPADPEALKIALLRLLAQSDLRENLGAAGLTLVQRTFSLDRMGKRYEDLFLQLLECKQ